MIYIFIVLLNILAIIITVKLTKKARKKEVDALKQKLAFVENQPVHIIRESRPLKRLKAQVRIDDEEIMYYPDAKLRAISSLAYELEKGIEKGMLEGQISVCEERLPIYHTTVYTAEIMIE